MDGVITGTEKSSQQTLLQRRRWLRVLVAHALASYVSWGLLTFVPSFSSWTTYQAELDAMAVWQFIAAPVYFPYAMFWPTYIYISLLLTLGLPPLFIFIEPLWLPVLRLWGCYVVSLLVFCSLFKRYEPMRKAKGGAPLSE